MGRIHKYFSRADGVAHLADILTTRGIVRRATCHLCPLPVARQKDDFNERPGVFEGGEVWCSRLQRNELAASGVLRGEGVNFPKNTNKIRQNLKLERAIAPDDCH